MITPEANVSSNVKVGSVVLIHLPHFTGVSGEDFYIEGWHDVWVHSMNKVVGNIGIVTNDERDGSFRVQCKDSEWNFPTCALEVIGDF